MAKLLGALNTLPKRVDNMSGLLITQRAKLLLVECPADLYEDLTDLAAVFGIEHRDAAFHQFITDLVVAALRDLPKPVRLSDLVNEVVANARFVRLQAKGDGDDSND
jgi:hypothetical protein